MKRGMVIGLFLACSGVAIAADEFWQQLTAEERVAAGIDQLTTEQRTVLDRLAARFGKEGARHAVAIAQEKGRQEGQAQAQQAAQEKKKASIGLAPREDDETEVVRTHIMGDFRGWEGKSTFQLANGQVWQQLPGESRNFPKMVDPEVEIRPSRAGGWKMTLVKEGLWIRVKRIR